MQTVTFEYEGATFTVRSETARDTLIKQALIVDAARHICTAKGLSIEAVPYSLDRLLSRFIDWMLVTKIDGDILPRGELYGAEVVGMFAAWDNLMITSPELWDKWDTAYKQVNESPLV